MDIYEGTDTRFDSILAGGVLAIAANPGSAIVCLI